MTSPGAPSHHHRVKKLDFHWSVVRNRGSTFSRRGVPGSGFEDQNGAKMDLQIMINVVKNEPRKSIRNSIPKVSQNGSKRKPKLNKNGIKNKGKWESLLGAELERKHAQNERKCDES